MATILFDDSSDVLVLGQDAVYETILSHNFIGGSASAIISGSLIFIFSGIEIALFGRMNRNDSSTRGVPVPSIGEIFMDGVPIESNVTVLDEVAIGLIYQLSQLSDTKHILTLSNVSSIILDYIEVTAGNTTSLPGSTLLLSSNNTAISYEGNWIHNAAILVDDLHQYRRPIGGATRDASFGNASATIAFTGTSIAVLGTSDPRAPCSPTFYLDGKEQSYHSPRRLGPNYPWFSSQQLANGNHVLKIDLSGNTSRAHFSLEYITYTASSENLDTNSHQISPSVFIGVGVGAGVVVIGILLVVSWWWNKRRSRRLESDTAATSTDTSEMPQPEHQDLDASHMNHLVDKSSLKAYSARNFSPRDFSAVMESTRQNEPSSSRETRHVSRIDNRSIQAQRLSHYEEQQIIKPLVPRRKEDARPPSELLKKIPNRSSTEKSSQITQVSVEIPRDTAPLGLASNPRHHNRKPSTYLSTTSEGTEITPIGHLPEGAWGMRVQQLEELMRELREGTAPSELGQDQDQVGTGHSTTLAGLMEEISELRKPVERNQSRGGVVFSTS